MGEVIEVHSEGPLPNPATWVCCLDCGLLIKPKIEKDKDWSICKVCTGVYRIGAEHPWIAQMMSYHLSGVPPRKKKFPVFRCNKCQNSFIAIGANKHGGATCFWCKAQNGGKSFKRGKRCIICNREVEKRYLATGICLCCLRETDKVKKALEYVYYIFGKTRAMRR